MPDGEEYEELVDHSKEYDLIYADPPWTYENDGNINGLANDHYDTMGIEEIKNIDVPAADDAILYLWATVTHLPEALDVLDAWGFEYKSQAMWDKEDMGVGFWFRGQHEQLLVGVRGDVSPPSEDHRRSSVFRSKRGKHSKKPAAVRRHIMDAHPDADKIELFARDGNVGWDVWGNEAPETLQDTLAVTDGGDRD